MNTIINNVSPLHLGVSADSTSIGGLNRFVRELIFAQRRLGINASLVGLREEQTAFDYCIGFQEISSYSIFNSVQRRRALKKLMAPYDLLDIHFAYSAWPLVVPRIPKVFHFHGPWSLEGKSKGDTRAIVFLKKQIELMVYRQIDEFIVLSQAFADLLVNTFHIPAKLINVVSPGIRLPSSRASTLSCTLFRNKYVISESKPLAICVRRLVPRMGLEFLIETFSLLEDPPQLLIIGEGMLHEKLERIINRLELADVITLTGRMSEADLLTAYEIADFSIMPSIELEGFGLSALESMAHGTPVIATAVNGLGELMRDIPEEFKIESGSHQDLARAINWILKTTDNYSELFLEHAKTYSWDRTVRETNFCYQNVMSK